MPVIHPKVNLEDFRTKLVQYINPRVVETPQHPLIASVEVLPPTLPNDPRPSVLDADGVPVKYLSGSRFNTFRRCGASYYFKYEKSLREPTNSSLIKGSAYHTGAQTIFLFKLLAQLEDPGAPFEAYRYLQAAIENAYKSIDIEVAGSPAMEPDGPGWGTQYPRGPQETLGSLKKAVAQAIEDSCATVFDLIVPVSVEQGFLIRWKDEGTLPLLGYADLIEQLNEREDGVIDFKTSAYEKEPIDLGLDSAITGYCNGHELTSGRPTNNVAYIAYATQKAPKITKVTGSRTFANLERVFAICKIASKAIPAGFFMPVDDKQKCAKCIFFKRECDALYAPSLAPNHADAA